MKEGVVEMGMYVGYGYETCILETFASGRQCFEKMKEAVSPASD